MNSNHERIAIVPGSFDPITYGHIDIVKRASAMYDKVYLAVMINSEKRYMFSLEERTELAKTAVADIPNVSVISSEGMLWSLALELGACAIVKGVRNEVDRAYEEKMAKFNFEHNPNAQTVLLTAADGLEAVSSTVVRDALASGKDLRGLLPDSVVEELLKIRSFKSIP